MWKPGVGLLFGAARGALQVTLRIARLICCGRQEPEQAWFKVGLAASASRVPEVRSAINACTGEHRLQLLVNTRVDQRYAQHEKAQNHERKDPSERIQIPAEHSRPTRTFAVIRLARPRPTLPLPR